METTQPIKRPTGMTILLVLSFLNACFNIFSNVVMYFFTPMMSEMIISGQLEEMMGSLMTTANEEMRTEMMNSMTMVSNIKPAFYLIMLVLFIASLIGVIKMFRWDKRGFHIYSIAQILMLIASSVYKYPLMQPSPFITDLLLTAMFILVYYLYFKRLEMTNRADSNNETSNPYGE